MVGSATSRRSQMSRAVQMVLKTMAGVPGAPQPVAGGAVLGHHLGVPGHLGAAPGEDQAGPLGSGGRHLEGDRRVGQHKPALPLLHGGASACF